MLDGRSASPGFHDGGSSEFDSGSGGGNSRDNGARSAGRSRASEAPKSFEKDLDDEIPF